MSESREITKPETLAKVQQIVDSARSHSGRVGANANHELSFMWCAGARADYLPLLNVPWGSFCERLVGEHGVRDRKDGPAIIGAVLRGGRRNEHAVCGTLLIYDVDGKLSLEEVIRRVTASGYEAMVWPTHNHLATKTKIGVRTFHKWLGEDCPP